MNSRAPDDPPLEVMVDAIMIDDASRDAPSRAALTGCDERAAREALLARLRRGEMTLRERAAAAMLAGRLNLMGFEGSLVAAASDATLTRSSRSCAVALLMMSPSAGAHLRTVERAVGAATWVSLHDEKLVLDLLLQMPSPGVADAMCRSLLGVPPAARAEVFARLDRCRRAAGMPAILAWRRGLAVQELGALHDVMAGAVADEAGEATGVVLEMLWRAAGDGGFRDRLARVVARVESRTLRGGTRPAQGSTHRIATPEREAQWMVCIAHPGRMTLVAHACEAGDALRVDGVFVLPAEPRVQVHGGDDPITLDYRVMSLTETRDHAVLRAKAMCAEGASLSHNLGLTLCLLDGLPLEALPDPSGACAT